MMDNSLIIKSMEKVYFTIKKRNIKVSLLKESFKDKVFYGMGKETFIEVDLKIIKSMEKVNLFLRTILFIVTKVILWRIDSTDLVKSSTLITIHIKEVSRRIKNMVKGFIM